MRVAILYKLSMYCASRTPITPWLYNSVFALSILATPVVVVHSYKQWTIKWGKSQSINKNSIQHYRHITANPPVTKEPQGSRMIPSTNGNIFCITGSLWGESIDDRWIPLTKAGDAELWCFLWCAPKQTIEQTHETPVIWDAIALTMTSLLCDPMSSLGQSFSYVT